MYCPNCRCEFRSGFARCEGCDVDLVAELPAVGTGPAFPVAPEAPLPVPQRLIDYCGFFTLEDARGARDRLRGQRIRSEVVIREAPDADWTAPLHEEYWIRVDGSRLREVAGMLGDDAGTIAEPSTDDDTRVACSDCGQLVAAEETFCSGCGARFEED